MLVKVERETTRSPIALELNGFTGPEKEFFRLSKGSANLESEDFELVRVLMGGFIGRFTHLTI